MIIPKQPIITWLTSPILQEYPRDIMLFQTQDQLAVKYLNDALNGLNICKKCGIFKGLIPYKLAASFEEAMDRCSEAFF